MSESKKGCSACMRVPDKYWQWVVLAFAGIVLMIRYGMLYGVGIIIADLKVVFSTSMTELTIITTLATILSNLFSFFPLWVKMKFTKNSNMRIAIIGCLTITIGCTLSSFVSNPSWLFLTYSIFTGLGASFLSIGAMSCVAEYFPRDSPHFILATSLVLLAMPLGSIVFNPLFYLIIDLVSWRGTFLFTAAFSLIFGVTCSLSFVSKKKESDESSILEVVKGEKEGEKMKIQDETGKSYQSVDLPNLGKLEEPQETKKGDSTEMGGETKTDTKTSTEKDSEGGKKKQSKKGGKPSIWRMFADSDRKAEIFLLFLATTLVTTAFAGLLTILPHFLLTRGLNTDESSIVMTSIGIFQLVSVLIAASLGKFLKGNLIWTLLITNFFMSAIFIGLIYAETFGHFLTCIALIGCLTGVNLAYVTSSTSEILNLPAEVSWAFSSSTRGFGSFFVPLVAGVIYDIAQNYSHTMIAFSSITLACSLCTVGIVVIQGVKRRRQAKESKV